MCLKKKYFTLVKFMSITSETDFVVNLFLCVANDLKTCITKDQSFISIISSNPGTGFKSVIYCWKYFSRFLMMDIIRI